MFINGGCCLCNLDPTLKMHTQVDLTTPILLAAANGHASTVKRLLQSGARVMDRDVCKRSPLLLAAAAGSGATVKVLGMWYIRSIEVLEHFAVPSAHYLSRFSVMTVHLS